MVGYASYAHAHKVYQIHTGNNMTYLQFLHDAIVLLLAVTPDIPIQVVGNDDILQRVSERYFPLFDSKHKVPLVYVPTGSVMFRQLRESKLQKANQ